MQTGADVLDRFKTVDAADIQRLTDAGSYSRGASYYRSGHIYDTVLRGATIQGQCSGSAAEDYRVRATFALADAPGDEPLTAFDCTCPRGGLCKHIVALLLTWIHRPEEFEAREEIATLLKDRSREDLLVLIARMLDQDPDLEALLELPVPTMQAVPGMGGKRTVEPATISKQVRAAFRRNGYEWGAASEIASDLERLKAIGDGYAQAGQWANAQAVYGTVAVEGAERYGEADDEGGALAAAIMGCVEGLANCLDAQAELSPEDHLEPAARAELVRTLYDCWNEIDFDLETDVPEVIARNVTPSERTQVEAWIRKAMRPGSAFSDQYQNRALMEFLMALKAHSDVSDADLLAEYRNFHLYSEAAGLLVKMGRIEEALAVAREHLPEAYSALQFAEQLLALGGTAVPQAFAFIEERLQKAEKGQRHEAAHYLGWLGKQYAAHGMAEKALATERRRFADSPSQETYEAAKAAAQMPGQPDGLWDRLRPELIGALERQNAWSLLTQIYLQEKDVRSALDALRRLDRVEGGGYFGSLWGLPELRERVAQAAERDFPEEALDIYQRLADNLIAQRGRENYQQAAVYLDRARALYNGLDLGALWKEYIADLRDRNRTLRALKEELEAAGL
jgi:uncharacterized Zn finger protein